MSMSSASDAGANDVESPEYIEEWQHAQVREPEWYARQGDRRRYFFHVDLQGRLFLEETEPKNIATCLKADKFLRFFFSRVRRNDLGWHQHEQHPQHADGPGASDRNNDDGDEEEEEEAELHNNPPAADSVSARPVHARAAATGLACRTAEERADDAVLGEYPFVSACGDEMNFIRPADQAVVFEDLREATPAEAERARKKRARRAAKRGQGGGEGQAQSAAVTQGGGGNELDGNAADGNAADDIDADDVDADGGGGGGGGRGASDGAATHVLVYGGGTLSVLFEPESLRVSETTGRLYHSSEDTGCPGFGLVRSQLAVQLFQHIVAGGGGDDDDDHLVIDWCGARSRIAELPEAWHNRQGLQ